MWRPFVASFTHSGVKADEQIKWQMVPRGGSKLQMVFRLPFAICHLNFDLLYCKEVGAAPAQH